MAKINQSISQNPDPAPDKDEQDPATFNGYADTLAESMVNWPDEYNTFGSEANDVRDEVNTFRDEAQNAQETAVGAANFKGEWSTLSDSLAVPASVLHNDKYWMLLNDLDDVTSCEPGVCNDWAEITLPPSRWTKEAEIDLSAQGGSFVVTDLPTAKDKLVFEFLGVSVDQNFASLEMQLSDDNGSSFITSSDYHIAGIDSTGTTTNSTDNDRFDLCPNTSWSSGSANSSLEIHYEAFNTTDTRVSHLQGVGATSNSSTGKREMLILTMDAIPSNKIDAVKFMLDAEQFGSGILRIWSA